MDLRFTPEEHAVRFAQDVLSHLIVEEEKIKSALRGQTPT